MSRQSHVSVRLLHVSEIHRVLRREPRVLHLVSKLRLAMCHLGLLRRPANKLPGRYRNYEKAWAKAGVVDEKDSMSLESGSSSLDKPRDEMVRTDAPQYAVDPELGKPSSPPRSPLKTKAGANTCAARETLSKITQLISSEAACAAASCRPRSYVAAPAPAAKPAGKAERWATSTLHPFVVDHVIAASGRDDRASRRAQRHHRNVPGAGIGEGA